MFSSLLYLMCFLNLVCLFVCFGGGVILKIFSCFYRLFREGEEFDFFHFSFLGRKEDCSTFSLSWISELMNIFIESIFKTFTAWRILGRCVFRQVLKTCFVICIFNRCIYLHVSFSGEFIFGDQLHGFGLAKEFKSNFFRHVWKFVCLEFSTQRLQTNKQRPSVYNKHKLK